MVDYTAVVYVNIPSQASPKVLSIALAQNLGQNYRSGATKSDITRVILDNMRRTGVELVIIDDAHFMDLSLKEAKVVNDLIANHTAATSINTGVDLKHSGFFLEGTGAARVTQTADRNTLLHMTPYNIRDQGRQRRLVSVITAMEDALVLYKPPRHPRRPVGVPVSPNRRQHQLPHGTHPRSGGRRGPHRSRAHRDGIIQRVAQRHESSSDLLLRAQPPGAGRRVSQLVQILNRDVGRGQERSRASR
ncbi:ATP-binding protein [Streptomyces sp. NPDC055243]|uniref:ATP-binding protein n=1 Tax=Streptomyces sp. NPDC055243 TaxID=3365720 RepID=UPI0037CF8169